MNQYQVVTRICDDAGANCSADLYILSTNLPTSTGFGIETGSVEFWIVVSSYTGMMSLVWIFKALLKFLKG